MCSMRAPGSIRSNANRRIRRRRRAHPDWSLLEKEEERRLALLCAVYPDVLRSAAEKMDCSVLVSHLLEVAKAFNRFYRECPVLTAESGPLRHARLALCYAVRDLLTDGLNTLTIQVPSAM